MIRYLIAYITTSLAFFQLDAEELRPTGVFTHAAVLYWQAEEGGLDYAIKSPSMSRLAPHAKIEHPDFDWDFGFKLGLGYRVAHDRWAIDLQFTSFQTHTDAEKKTEDVFFPVWQKPVSSIVTFAKEVKMHWRLHLGLLDLMLCKSFYATPTLILTPEWGLRTGWIRQKFNLEYRGGNQEDVLLRMKNKYWGLGLKWGLKGEWQLGQGFSLFGEGAASILYGEFYIHQDEDTLATKVKILGIHNIFRRAAPILEMLAGMRWQRYFSGGLNRLQIDLSWDQLLFFSQNQLLLFLDANAQGDFVSNQGDLAIAGVELAFRFDF